MIKAQRWTKRMLMRERIRLALLMSIHPRSLQVGRCLLGVISMSTGIFPKVQYIMEDDRYPKITRKYYGALTKGELTMYSFGLDAWFFGYKGKVWRWLDTQNTSHCMWLH